MLKIGAYCNAIHGNENLKSAVADAINEFYHANKARQAGADVTIPTTFQYRNRTFTIEIRKGLITLREGKKIYVWNPNYPLTKDCCLFIANKDFEEYLNADYPSKDGHF